MKTTDTEKAALREPAEALGMQRRDFFKLLGAGIFIVFETWDPWDLLAMPAEQQRALP
jgi:hypothetical protein